MNDIREIQHDLRRDFYNIMNLLKFINEENLTKDQSLTDMLKMCLEREGQTIQNLQMVDEFLSMERA